MDERSSKEKRHGPLIMKTQAGDAGRPKKIEPEPVKQLEGLEAAVREKTVALDLLNKKLAQEIQDHRITRARLQKALEEKDLLLREINHRVKNNMQVISSLLSLQARKIKDAGTTAVFKEAQGRVRAMALVHEILYQSETLAGIDLTDYLTKLASSIIKSFGAEAQGVRLSVKADGVTLGVNQAVPCGLVVNELITNSLKHAFPHGGPGLIHIVARSVEGEMEMTIGDDGVGIPAELDWRHSKTLGLSLVLGLVEQQLGGQVRLVRNGGARFVIRCDREADRL